MLRDNERIDDLVWRGLKIIQNPRWFCFSLDAVLLARFATVKPGDHITDLGTGTGVIPLLLNARMRDINITGLEIHREVVEMARRSVVLNQLSDSIQIIQGDIKEASQILGKGKFDLVSSNPPYTKATAGRISTCPIKSSARTEILCTLEDVIKEGARLLNTGGRLALVHRPQRLVDIFSYMRSYGLEPKRMRLVYPSLDKEPGMVLVEGIKESRADLLVSPPLIIYKEPGVYTDEIKNIFAGEFLSEKW